MRRHMLVAGLGAIALLVGTLAESGGAQEASSAPAARPGQAEESRQYSVDGPQTARQRTDVGRTGAAIDDVRAGGLVVTATPSEAEAIGRLGYEVTPLDTVAPQVLPPGYEDYHDYAELTAEVNQVVGAFPAIAQRVTIGQSFQGRDIMAVKISDNVATDEAEPEVLFTHSQHAREILTVEMAVHLLDLFTTGYGSDARITQLVDSREIWILPNVNPDGSEYDKTATGFRLWRKNRQPNSGTTAVGTDPNRNWAYNWGCCGGSSGNPSSETYRGAAPESAPEVRVVADFVRSRVVGGVQQITSHIDWHTYGELILWPFGYTFADTAPGLTPTDRQAFATLGQAMAATNGYTPQQSSDLYITDGTIGDWMWGNQRIFSYTFEMFPEGDPPGFYPGDEAIVAETTRNTDAVLLMLDYADCPYRIIGLTCGPPPATVFSDDFETSLGWTTNPNGTDTATSGQWQRADPQGTSSGVTLQLGTTTSGLNDLVTGATADTTAGANDVDGGVTSIQSPAITLPATGTLGLSARWYLAHLNNATSADHFRVSVVSGATTTTVFQQQGAASNRAGAWGTLTADLTPFAGQTIRILVETLDTASASLVETGVDDVRITHQT
jgi:carboxypeptidase T